MTSTWDKIFNSNASLTEEECERAFRELAEAVSGVTKMLTSPEHERIKKQIEEKMAQGKPVA